MTDIRLSRALTSPFLRTPTSIPIQVHTTSVANAMNTSIVTNIDCGALTANVWKTVATDGVAGILLCASIQQNNTTSQAISLRVYLDDILAGEGTKPASTTTASGVTSLLNSGTVTASTTWFGVQYPYNTLRIDVMSTIARSAGSSILLSLVKYNV